MAKMNGPLLSMEARGMIARRYVYQRTQGGQSMRYTRKDSVGSIVRTFPNGRQRKPPTIRARCYAPPGTIIETFLI